MYFAQRRTRSATCSALLGNATPSASDFHRLRQSVKNGATSCSSTRSPFGETIAMTSSRNSDFTFFTVRPSLSASTFKLLTRESRFPSEPRPPLSFRRSAAHSRKQRSFHRSKFQRHRPLWLPLRKRCHRGRPGEPPADRDQMAIPTLRLLQSSLPVG
ncbi:hypothetical protein D3C86_1677540 [compost metagenome]